MTSNRKQGCVPLPEVRVILIGERWSGKSCSGNTLLKKDMLQCGRTRTAQSERRHNEVEGRDLIVVDAPGWGATPSLTEIPEADKQRFKLNVSKCLPGPHAFLLVTPVDSAFNVAERRPVEEHMKLLGERAWRNTMVLFTSGDLLGEKSIEQHIESEGDALRWLVQRCGNRYHVFDNKDKSNSAQVTQLLEKIDKMVWDNKGSCYEADERTLCIIEDKQREAAARAKERRMKAEEQRQQLKALTPEASKAIPELRMVLLGSRDVGKSSTGNTILGIKFQKDGKRTVRSVVRKGFVDKTAVTLVDTPGWWKGYSASNTSELIKQEVMSAMFLCPPGPHVFLLVIDADASFNKKDRDAVTGHLEILGKDVWKHTMVVFTRGDWLGTKTIEEHIELEGEALQSLVNKCGNRYHVIDNKNTDDGTQVTEMLEKIGEIVAGNIGNHFVPDEKMFLAIEEKRKKVEEGAKLRQTQVETKRNSLKGSRNKLQEIRIVMLGQKTVGKSATGNTILCKEVFGCDTDTCEEGKGKVAGRLVTVIDTPGWWKNSSLCTKKTDKEIVRGVSLCPPGAHALLLVIPSDMEFSEMQQRALEEHVCLFGDSVWKHTLVLFTYGGALMDTAIERHIEREEDPLRGLVEKCENRYHVFSNTRKNDVTQVAELLEKIEEMVAGNGGQVFSPDMNDIHQRIEEKSRRKEVSSVLRWCHQLESEYRSRELELMTGFKQTLVDLEDEIRGRDKTLKQKLTFGARGLGPVKKDAMEKEEKIQQKINQTIEKLDKDILRSTELQRKSREFMPPSLSGESLASSVAGSLPDLDHRRPSTNFEKVLGWLSNLNIDQIVEDQLTLNFSQTSSGYKSQLQEETPALNRLHSLFERDSES